MIRKTYKLLENDLSAFSDCDLKATLKFLWSKPYKFWLWHLTIPATIAIKMELEFRKALKNGN